MVERKFFGRSVAPSSFSAWGPWQQRGCIALVLALSACGGGDKSSNTPSTQSAGPGRLQAQAGGAIVDQQIPFLGRLAAGEKVTIISVCTNGSYIEGLKLTTNLNVTYAHGNTTSGRCDPIRLANGETITRVYGTGFGVIDSLSIETSGRTLGPYGNTNGGDPFSMTPDSEGFRGWSGTTATFQGATVIAQLNLVGALTGGTGGTPFMDKMQPDEKVTEVKICALITETPSAPTLQGVQLTTKAGQHLSHGVTTASATVQCTTTLIPDNEYIVQLEGTTQRYPEGSGEANRYVNSLRFRTNFGTYAQAGPFTGTFFNQTVRENGRFAGWYGSSGTWLNKIAMMSHPVGNNGPLPAEDAKVQVFNDLLQTGARVAQVNVCANGTQVYAVQAIPDKGKLPLNGAQPAGVTCQPVFFSAGEYITEMFGLASTEKVYSIGFRTNTGSEIKPIGNTTPEPTHTPYLLRNPQASAFLGFAGRYVFKDSLIALEFATVDQFAPMLPASDTAATNGWWGDLMPWPINAIHASVLGNGGVLTYGSDTSGAQGGVVYDVWTPPQALAVGNGEHMTLLNEGSTPTDIFCSAQTLLASGQVLLAGGDSRQTGSFNGGVTDVNRFNPVDNSLKLDVVPAPAPASASKMAKPRWYASQIMLPSGRILVAGGRQVTYPDTQYIPEPELYDPKLGWVTLSGVANNAFVGDYPRLFVPTRSSDGDTDEVYVIPTNKRDNDTASKIYRLTIPKQNPQLTSSVEYTNKDLHGIHNWQQPATQFAPGKVLIHHSLGDGSGAMDVVTFASGAVPVVTAAQPMSQTRMWSNFVLLPTGDVLVLGGSKKDIKEQPLATAARYPEIWTPGDKPEDDPANATWRKLNTNELRPRLYHSTAMVLPDGRVLSAGGGSPGPLLNLNAQLFSPPSLYKGSTTGSYAARPVIKSNIMSMTVGGDPIAVNATKANEIIKVTLTRLGSATHAFDFDARYMTLTFNALTDMTLSVTPPANHFYAPPGQYLLTIVNTAGVPSVSKVVSIF